MASNENLWGGSGSADQKLSNRVNQKFGRTKDAASAGVEKTRVVATAGYEKTKEAARKVKDGASTGVSWIKLKCKKTKLFQK